MKNKNYFKLWMTLHWQRVKSASFIITEAVRHFSANSLNMKTPIRSMNLTKLHNEYFIYTVYPLCYNERICTHVKHSKFILKKMFTEILNGFSQPGSVITFNRNACFWLQCSNHFVNRYMQWKMQCICIIEECEILHVSGLLALQVVVMGVVGQSLGLLVMVVVDWVSLVVVGP